MVTAVGNVMTSASAKKALTDAMIDDHIHHKEAPMCS